MYMTKHQRLLVSFKLFFGLLALSSVLTEIVVLSDRGKLVPVNFFSFFTIESNIFAASALLLGAVMVGRTKQPSWLPMIRGAATLYMVMTGVIFSVLLSGLNVQLTAIPWDNIVLHYIMPVVLVIDWIVDPPKKKMSFRQGLVWIIFPLVYVFYTLVRGALVGWYPYPFLNPATGGYDRIFFVSVFIMAAVLLLIQIMVQYSHKANDKKKRLR